MEYRRLGSSELVVSEVALGSWLTIAGGIERDRAEAVVRRALDLGINFIDTANEYGQGAAESLLGDVLRGVDRDSYVLATKVFFPMSDTDKGLSAPQIRKQLDASLQRLGVDHVDLYQCHRYDEETPLEETMGALTEAVRQGKARYIGFSEWTQAQIQAALDMAGKPAGETSDVEHFVSSQPMYSMLWRRPEDKVFPLCKDNGIGQIVFSPLGQGVLTGKYRPGQPPPADSRAANESMNMFMGAFTSDPVLEKVERLQPVADKAGLSLAQLAIAWVLRDEAVTSAIVGASKPEQLDDNVGGSGVRLDADTLAAIDEALA